MLRRVGTCGALESLGAAPEPQHKPYVRAGWARVDRMAYTVHTWTRGFHTERLSSHASDPCIPACSSQCAVVPHSTPPEPRHDEHEREVHAGLARGHCTACGDCSRSRGRRIARLVKVLRTCFYPPWKVTNSTPARASRSWLLAPVVRSKCSCATQRPVPAGSTLFGRRVGVVPVAYRPIRLVPLTGLRRSPGHLQLPTSGKARCACCARRGRSGAPRGSPASLRRARPTRRFPH